MKRDGFYRGYAALLLAMASVMGACEEDPVTVRRIDPATLVVDGPGESGRVGERLAQPLLVSVVRQDGTRMLNVPVALISPHSRARSLV